MSLKTNIASKPHKALLMGSLLIFLSAGFWLAQSDAALPAEVDGQLMPSLAPMLEQVTPAVVNIATEGRVKIRQNPLLNDPFFRRFFNIPNQPTERKTQSLGSGVIVDAKRGLILTNNHVISNAVEITVTLRDGRSMDAKLVGTDPETEVAVIQIPAEELTATPIANSEELRVGDFVVAIGNPFGLGQTVTSGIVSALGRNGQGIVGYEDFIQTDASINPGNSGGALVNLRGELVGINTAILSQSGGSVGIGFAIPVNMAMQVLEQIVEYGEVKRGYLGGQTQDLTPELAEAFGLTQHNGAVIVNVAPGSPAAEAGLMAGDVVLSVNGKKIDNSSDLRNHVGMLRVGDKVKFDILRAGERLRIEAKIGEIEADKKAMSLKNPRLAGATFAEIDEDSPFYGQVKGVLVLSVERGGRSWKNGLRDGDVVTSVNKEPVTDLKEFLAAVNQDNNLLFRVRRGNSAAYLIMK